MGRRKKRPKSGKRAGKRRARAGNGAHGGAAGGSSSRQRGVGGGASPDAKVIHLFSFEITCEPLPHPSMRRLPADIDLRLQYLHGILRSDPARALMELEPLHERFPKAVVITNWLITCLVAVGRREEARRLAEALVAGNPDYLFGRITLAEICLNELDFEAADRFLGELKHPRALCPRRKVFHVTEMLSYFFVVGKFHVMNGNLAAAESCLELLKTIDPEASTVGELARLLAPERSVSLRALAALKNLAENLRGGGEAARHRDARTRPPRKRAVPRSDRDDSLFAWGGVELKAGEDAAR